MYFDSTVYCTVLHRFLKIEKTRFSLPIYSAEEILCLQEGEHTEVFKVDLAKCVEFLKERTKCGDIVDSRVWSLFTGLSLGLGK